MNKVQNSCTSKLCMSSYLTKIQFSFYKVYFLDPILYSDAV